VKRIGITKFFAAVLITATVRISMAADPSNDALLNIGDVTINESVRVVMPPYYHGSEQSLGAVLGGGIGGAVAANATKGEPARIAAYVEQQGIDIGALVRTEFERQLKLKPGMADHIQPDAPSKFSLSIKYGISKIGLSGYKPYLVLEAKLVAADGSEVWKQKDYVGGLNSSTPSLKYEDYFTSPEIFKSAFIAAAKEVVTLVLKKF
jgi:hypothetical protein